MTKRVIGCGLVMLALVWSTAAPASARDGKQHGSAGRGTQGYLGIDVRDVSDDQVPSLKLKDTHGAEIIRVDHDGPAGKMGLREHDVVVQMNGAMIEGEEQIRRMLREIAPGRQVALVISRDGQQITLTAQMANRTEVERQAWEQHLVAPPAPQPLGTGLPEDQAPQMGQVSAAAAPSAKYSKGFLGTILLTPAYTGVMLERVGPQLAQFFGAPRGSSLLVKGVDNNSPAAVAGVRAGDMLLRANSKPVTTLTDWARVVRDAKGKPVTLVVLRDRKETTLSLTPDAKKP